MSEPARVEDSQVAETASTPEGSIERSLLLPPGMRAREYIEQIRAAGKPYPLAQMHDKAQNFQHEGSLADAHLLYFFAARENHLPAMMVMAQLSDPILFRAENSLLDQADAIQAFKWYSKAAELGQPDAAGSIDKLRQWAQDAAAAGDPEARQLLLNIQ
jgi:TPR repeat protein